MKFKNWLYTRIIVLIILAIFVGVNFVQYSQDQYNQGLEITENKYLEKFTDYKNGLLSFQPTTNYTYSLFITFFAMAILVGSYELIVFLISLFLRKLLD